MQSQVVRELLDLSQDGPVQSSFVKAVCEDHGEVGSDESRTNAMVDHSQLVGSEVCQGHDLSQVC